MCRSDAWSFEAFVPSRVLASLVFITRLTHLRLPQEGPEGRVLVAGVHLRDPVQVERPHQLPLHVAERPQVGADPLGNVVREVPSHQV